MSGDPSQGNTRFESVVGDILISTDDIAGKVLELGQAISRDYAGRTPLLVGALKGVIYFLSDLLRAIAIPVEVDYISVSSYSAAARDLGLVRFVKDLDLPLTGRHVIFVEDVIESGLTLNYLLRNLRLRKPASLQVCVLLDKRQHRLIDIPVKYKGFELPDRMVVGYGLDYRERYRNLPFVGLLKPQALQTPRSG